MVVKDQFYTYLWLRDDGTPYYAGKGKMSRGFVSQGHRVRCPKDSQRIIIQNWDSEADAFEAEKLLIAVYGRKDLGTGCLRNLTDGGEGIAGLSVVARKYKSIIMQGNKNGLGYKHTTDAKEKIALAASCPHPWNSGQFRGRHHTPESKKKLSLSKQQKICKRGHSLSEDNLSVSVRHDGRDGGLRIKRNCKACTHARLEVSNAVSV